MVVHPLQSINICSPIRTWWLLWTSREGTYHPHCTFFYFSFLQGIIVNQRITVWKSELKSLINHTCHHSPKCGWLKIHPNASLPWPHHSPDMKSHTLPIRDYLNPHKGRIKTKTESKLENTETCMRGKHITGKSKGCWNKSSHHEKQRRQSFGPHWII
jgi:hypothetical protein